MNVPADVLALCFDEAIAGQTRRRIRYAFQVFAAIHGFRITEESRSSNNAACLYYSPTPPSSTASKMFWVPARYVARPATRPAPRPRTIAVQGQRLHLFYGRDVRTGRPDWLGEAFEWLSAADEHAISARDSVGRIPFSATVFGRYDISPLTPWAGVLFSWLKHGLDQNGKEGFTSARSPDETVSHFVVPTHDIDFYHVGWLGTAQRLVKNMAIACLIKRSPSFLLSNLVLLARLVCGRKVGQYGEKMLRTFPGLGYRTSCFVIARSSHKRDANYSLEDVDELLRRLQETGFDIGTHGSYESVMENDGLTSEAEALRKIGIEVHGNRQHWLRFSHHEKLYRSVSRSGLVYDSSLSFVETPGFRNGACFSFPPYCFEREEAVDFFEIPLVVMDTTLSRWRDAEARVENVLEESRRWGWGGIAIVWHNPFEPLNTTKEINEIFWKLDRERSNHEKECWLAGQNLIERIAQRYVDAGLEILGSCPKERLVSS